MRIAILADPLDLQHAGIHQYTAQLIEALGKYDKENHYLVLRQKAGRVPEGMEQIVVPGLWPFQKSSAFRNFISLPRAIKELKVDAVFEPAHFGPFNVSNETIRITMVHDITPILFPQTHPLASVLAHHLLMGRVLKKAHLVLVNSDSTLNDVNKKYPRFSTNIRRIYLGRDDFFYPKEEPEKLQTVGVTRPYFLNVGTIEPRKNLLTLLKAYESYRKNGGTNLLVITGKMGWKTKGFSRTIASSPYKKEIILTGFVTKDVLRNLYSCAAAFIYPSLYEGFGIPVVEAMACGCPVIVSDTSSLREVGGNAALRFAPMDEQGLATQLEVASDADIRPGLVEAGKEQAGKFTWESYVQEFKKLLSLLAQ